MWRRLILPEPLHFSILLKPTVIADTQCLPRLIRPIGSVRPLACGCYQFGLLLGGCGNDERSIRPGLGPLVLASKHPNPDTCRILLKPMNFVKVLLLNFQQHQAVTEEWL